MADEEPWFSLPDPNPGREAIVIGAGLAGCCISYALSLRGISVQLLDCADAAATSASGNPKAIIRPHIIRSAGLLNDFNQAAFTQSLALLNKLGRQHPTLEYAQPGALQLFDRSGPWPEMSTGIALDAASATAVAGVDLTSPALHFPDAAWVNGSSLCQALIDASSRVSVQYTTNVTGITCRGDIWQVHREGSQIPQQAPLIIFATGTSTPRFELLRFLELTVSAGQTTHCRYQTDAIRTNSILCGKRFLVPVGDECVIGSTHWHAGNSTMPLSLDPSDADNADNLRACHALIQNLPAQLSAIGQWRALRASTPDRLPLVGAVPDLAFYSKAYADLRHGHKHRHWPQARYHKGLYILTGLGSRGFSTAPTAAEILADVITGSASIGQQKKPGYARLLHPARFLIRQLKRARAAQ